MHFLFAVACTVDCTIAGEYYFVKVGGGGVNIKRNLYAYRSGLQMAFYY